MAFIVGNAIDGVGLELANTKYKNLRYRISTGALLGSNGVCSVDDANFFLITEEGLFGGDVVIYPFSTGQVAKNAYASTNGNCGLFDHIGYLLPEYNKLNRSHKIVMDRSTAFFGALQRHHPERAF